MLTARTHYRKLSALCVRLGPCLHVRALRALGGLLLPTIGGATACAAISGLDSYSAEPGGTRGAAADGSGGGEERGLESADSERPDVEGPANDGSLEDDGSVDASGSGQGASLESGRSDSGPFDSGKEPATEAGSDTGCTPGSLPPSVNVSVSQWTFASSPAWSCTNNATTTITAIASGASISGDTCAGSAALSDATNGVAQSNGGPPALVIRLKDLTVTGNHVIQLVGDEPVIFLVDGDVTIDSGGTIDAGANGTMAGPGGDSSSCGTSDGAGSTSTTTGGGGGGFGTAGGYGADESGNMASAGGAAASNPMLQPLRGGCGGGAGANGTNPGGAGGGAFEINASGRITVGATGAAYLSAAGGYSPGASTSTDSDGSGGAGSGGGVLLVSPTLATFSNGSTLRVHGGGAGSSHGLSANSNNGSNGATTTNTPAAGGTAPDIGGAAGGAGGLCAGTGTACATSQAGANGGGTGPIAGGNGSGGGGGGGSVQVISAPATLVCH